MGETWQSIFLLHYPGGRSRLNHIVLGHTRQPGMLGALLGFLRKSGKKQKLGTAQDETFCRLGVVGCAWSGALKEMAPVGGLEACRQLSTNRSPCPLQTHFWLGLCCCWDGRAFHSLRGFVLTESFDSPGSLVC